MKIAINWLKEYIELTEDDETIAQALTSTGLEVEGLETFEEVKGNLQGIVIGEVFTCEQHPNADKLKVTTVSIGEEEPLPIVCGAPNVAKGQKVAVALVGTTLYPSEGELITLKKAKIRGEVSQGMICAEDELGIGKSHEGILVLDTDLPNGTPFSEYFNVYSTEVLEIGLTPNRVDASSHIGTARDLSAFFKRPYKMPSVENFKVDNQNLPIEVIVENTEACPRYSGITISNVKVESSPKWLQNHLKSIGLAPINNIVDTTNFVLQEIGQPLHAFDADKIKGNKVIVKNLPQDTSFVTLDGEERKLSEKDLMICNEEVGMCIAGVFGGIDSGITENTQNIFLESAYFHPDSVRFTSLYHGLKTDAAFRFERGTDPNITVYALKRAALLIKEIAGGEISSEIVDIYPNPIPNFEVNIDYKRINKLIGHSLEKDVIKNILELLEIKIIKEEGDKATLSVPTYRVDVQREADIVEEILRIYGYDNVPLLPYAKSDYLANFPKIDVFQLRWSLSQTLASRGFCEMMNNSLTKPNYAEMLQEENQNKHVKMLNPLSEDLEVLRQSMLFSGLESIAYNINRKQSNLKLFEFGKTYQKTKEAYKETQVLALFMAGNTLEENWQQKPQKIRFYDISGVSQDIFKKFALENLTQEEANPDIFQYGLAYFYKKKKIAEIGLVKSNLTKALDIKTEVFYAEINWELLCKEYSTEMQYKAIPKFPQVKRDLSLVLDKNITFKQVEELAFKRERKLLQKIQVFDVYEGDRIEEGKKAYAISFILQDLNKTLTDKVIDKTMKQLSKAFEAELAAQIRQ